MKKFLVVLLSIFSCVAILANNVKAESANIISNGDFEGMLVDGQDAPLTEIRNGFGSLEWDSYATVTKDPLNADNTVMKFSYTVDGKAFSSFFKFCTVEANTTYDISFKYLVVGETDNFGMRFAGPTSKPEYTFYSGAATDGWQEASFQLTTVEDGVYDSIGVWFNTKSSAENAGYMDDIVITKVENTEEQPIITSGDFEGLLNDGNDVALGGAPFVDGYGSGDWDSNAVITKDPLDASNTVLKLSYTVENKPFSSFFKFCTLKPSTTYKIDFDYMVVGETDNFGMRFAPDVPKLETTFYEGGATDGWEHATWEWTTDKDSSYDSIGVWFNTGSSLDNVGYIDNIVITMVEEVEPEPEPEIENPFDPNKTYYQSESMTVNGDFEKFAVGTIFSEEQLEGAWGSVNLDNPATIQEVNGSHVMDITAGAKVYSSAFLMMPDTLEVGDLLRLTYDIKLVLSDEAASYTAIDSCLVGGSNVSYYTINYKALDFAGTTNMTSGEELLNYPITITAKENGWYTVSFDFQLTSRDLIQTNSVRFLFTAKSADDHMYIDNVNLYSLSETPFDTSVKVQSIAFNDGASVNMTIGDEKTLGYTINPSDATDKSVTFTSSNESVATVDANGKVVAVGKGACTVTVTAANGVTAEIAILVAEKAAEPAKGCWGSVGASILGVISLAGAAFVVAKRKKD